MANIFRGIVYVNYHRVVTMLLKDFNLNSTDNVKMPIITKIHECSKQGNLYY